MTMGFHVRAMNGSIQQQKTEQFEQNVINLLNYSAGILFFSLFFVVKKSLCVIY